MFTIQRPRGRPPERRFHALAIRGLKIMICPTVVTSMWDVQRPGLLREGNPKDVCFEWASLDGASLDHATNSNGTLSPSGPDSSGKPCLSHTNMLQAERKVTFSARGALEVRLVFVFD